MATHGVIGSYVHHDRKMAAMVALCCETDFVAKNEEFIKLAQDLAMHVVANKTTCVGCFKKELFVLDDTKNIGYILGGACKKFGEKIIVKHIQYIEM